MSAEPAAAKSTVSSRRLWLIAVLFSDQKCQNISVQKSGLRGQAPLLAGEGMRVCSGEMQCAQGHSAG